jgi:hypothetical protein
MQCFSVMMEHRVDVLGPQTTSRDAGGGTSVTWGTTRASDVACLINAPMASESERFAQPNLIGTVTVATFYSGVTRGDKLVVTAGPPFVGAQLHVTGVKKQPGVAALGFSDLYHVTGELIL